jgi:hypothetical protein
MALRFLREPPPSDRSGHILLLSGIHLLNKGIPNQSHVLGAMVYDYCSQCFLI